VLVFRSLERGVRPSVLTALEEQLGLSCSPQRGPVEVLAVDRVERSTKGCLLRWTGP
jgi:uncharacterized protein (TIGR03435 family)